MKVLVTGASGFLGGGLVARLLAEGHQVRILARPQSQFTEIDVSKVSFALGDVTNLQSLQDACRDVDTVFHLAGLVAYSRAQRAAMQAVNVDGTANVIRAVEDQRVRRLVHVSSVVAIGASFDGKVPLNENSEYNVTHLDLGYFETKRQAELLVLKATKEKQIDSVILNPSTIYGPADAKKGSRGVQLKVANGKFPFYPPGGVAVVSSLDVIECLMAAWLRGKSGERYIVSSENLLIKDVFAMIARFSGVKAPQIALPRKLIFAMGRVGDVLERIGKKGPLNTENAWTSVLYHWFEAKKAESEFKIRFRPAAEAIETSVKWIKDNHLA